MQRLQKLYVDIPALREGTSGAYAFAFLMTAVATVLRLAIDPYVTGVQYITFFPAVIVTTFICGFRAGLLCMALSTISAWFFVLPPAFSFRIADGEQVLGASLFAFVATADVIFIGAMRYAIERYRELSRTLEERVAEGSHELLKTQERLAQSQKLEAIGQLTGGLAHDFNNMLAIILGNLDIVHRRLSSGRTDVVAHVENAIEGSRRAAQLTQRLLAFARKQPLMPAVVDINKLTSGACELLQRTLGGGVVVECIQAGGLWKGHIDPGQLESAIVNLSVNARDAMPDGGTLTIETANAYLDEEYAAKHEDVRAGQYVLIAVTDTGVGMSPDVAARAIEPFFTTKRPGKGTGLGLSQVFGFLKQSGGHMSIYSEEGRGTTVRLYIKRAYLPAAQPEPHRVEMALPPGSAHETILIAEDEEQVRAMAAAALRELGYQVQEAADGSEALEILSKDSAISLLLTDVVMPGMNGRKLAEAASEIRAVPVIFMTGYTRNAIVHDGTLDQDVDLLSKPFTVEQLARKIRRALDRGG